jgi:hypothetical protein
LFKRIIKVQGRDKGSSVAFDYDNKTMTLTNDSNIYTIYSNVRNERLLTFIAMFNADLTIDVQRH